MSENRSSEIPLNTIEEEHRSHEDDIKEFQDVLNEFDLDINVNNSDDAGETNFSEEEDRKYHKNVKYMANQDFHITNNESFPISNPNSIPNTFKYKSFPNAKTKSQLGLNAPTTRDNGPMKTSTLDKTPDWMPSELNGERWIESPEQDHDLEADLQSSVRITKNPSLNFQLPSTNNSIIHNSRSQQETPAWKKAKETYEKQSKNNLQQVFLNYDKSNVNSHSMSSTLSTPYHSIKQNQITRDQLRENSEKQTGMISMEPSANISPLKLFGPDYNTFTQGKLNELLGHLKGPPPPFQLNNTQHNRIAENPREEEEAERGDVEVEQAFHKQEVSPEEFTMHSVTEEGHQDQETSDWEDNTGSTASGELTSNMKPRLKTRAIDNDIESRFKMKANNIFDNIQKRGAFLQPSRSISTGYSPANGTSIATVTSTPKLNKISNIDEVDDLNDFKDSNDYSSFTSGFYEESTQFPNNESTKNQYAHSNEYTSFTGSESISSIDQSSPVRMSEIEESNEEDTSHSNVRPNHLNTSFTYEKISDDNDVYSSTVSNISRSKENSEAYNQELEERVKFLEAQLSSVNNLKKSMHSLAEENELLRNELEKSHITQDKQSETLSIDDYDLTADRSMEDFRMKRISQLKLQNINLNTTPQKGKGTLKPTSSLPLSYENMIFDKENQRWISRVDKENYFGSLDEIEDLVSESEREENDNTMDGNTTITRKEVSFHLPHTEQVNSSPNHMSGDGANVTRSSQVGNMSFSQQQQKLVSVITGHMMESNEDWNKVTEFSLIGENLSNVKDFHKFLPNLLKLNLSNNQIKYLKGLPVNLLNLNLTGNSIENLTSFKEFLDLQNLILVNNKLTNCTSLKYNIHLTKLNLSNNNLSSIEGLNNLTNLLYLDLSMNDLVDTIDFLKFKFDNLQDLNVSENRIQAIKNLQAVPNLRILNLNENKLTQLSCNGRHTHLKKLLVKFNKLTRLDFNKFPYLRVLRMDGNNFDSVSGNLKYLEELSVKCQDTELLENVLNSKLSSLKILDVSGNLQFFQTKMREHQFLNVNKLTLSALHLTSLPQKLSQIFPNLMDLNLNFNRLDSLEGLCDFKHLKRVYLLSNNLTKIEAIVRNLSGSRASLKILDLRLNPVNIDFYPFVFNPQELEKESGNKFEANNLPIELENLDDIENFSIHYETLNNNVHDNDWSIRDELFSHGLSINKVTRKVDYLTLLINYFPNLRKLDGSLIDAEKRREYERNLHSTLA
ncbi:hypothetical protein PSN45_005200 [Yamadazyma tenuis]|uniref:uncharacterized protein n=1 Tax=Candida tenuis TaxID=2315449 RepID=UPI0027980D6E|nr:hypothetical protein PSN45_005200 [Yamadazyma tenuis]